MQTRRYLPTRKVEILSSCRSLALLSVLFILILTSFFSAPTAFAQITATPNTMNFSGRLARPDGTPVPDGPYTLTFRIYDASIGGMKRWEEPVGSVHTRNGTFAATLGRDVPFDANIFNGTVWLEIQINLDTPLIPRQRISTVAYAFKANTVPDNAITTAKIADGAITQVKLAPGVGGLPAWLLGGNSDITLSHFLGTTNNQPLELRVNNWRANRYSYSENTASTGVEFRSINVLGGANINTITSGVVGATIAGGGRDYFAGIDLPNNVTGDFGTVGGGQANTASSSATVGGGKSNTANGFSATVGGGESNTASDEFASLGGGAANIASGRSATVAGGERNKATNPFAIVAGGRDNTASGSDASILGGDTNVASGNWATAAGGRLNTAGGQFSFAAGFRAKANHQGTFVWADGTDADFISTGTNQFIIRATGNVGINDNSPSYALVVNGTIRCLGFINDSDGRYKQNIHTFDNALDTILNLRGVTFDWNRDKWKDKNFPDGQQIGFIAQEVEKVRPELVMTDSKGYKSVAYANVVPVLVEAVKTLKKENDRKDAELAEVKAKNAEIEAQLVAILRRLEQIENADKK